MSAPSSDPFIYAKALGWNEFDERGDRVPVTLCVIDSKIGYNILRFGEYCEHLEWFLSREDAIDWAVDYQRKEVAEHELRQVERG